MSNPILVIAPVLLGLCLCAFPLVGLVIGLAQWWVLRSQSRNLWPWLLANMVGWGIGLFVGTVLLRLVGSVFGPNMAISVVITLLAGGLAGAIIGGATGWALMRVLKN